MDLKKKRSKRVSGSENSVAVFGESESGETLQTSNSFIEFCVAMRESEREREREVRSVMPL